tara:strand:- start:940 stop:1290 length:351 start_codon:yes stop_codon:yes gene_type:complete
MAREPMPNMAGANMSVDNPMRNLPPEAMKNLLKPDEEIAAMLVARLSAMSEQELRMLDTVITPEVAKVLMKLLPELQELIEAVGGGAAQQAPQAAQQAQQAAPQAAPPMGALGGMT